MKVCFAEAICDPSKQDAKPGKMIWDIEACHGPAKTLLGSGLSIHLYEGIPIDLHENPVLQFVGIKKARKKQWLFFTKIWSSDCLTEKRSSVRKPGQIR